MDKSEYLLFIPLLIYGIALSDLFGRWKILLSPKNFYWPYPLTIFLFSESAIYNVFKYYYYSERLVDAHYFTYCAYLLPPIIFMMMSNFLTNNIDETKDSRLKFVFTERIKQVFILLAIFMLITALPFYQIDQGRFPYLKLVAIPFALLYAFSKKTVYFYLLITLWAAGVLLKYYKVVYENAIY